MSMVMLVDKLSEIQRIFYPVYWSSIMVSNSNTDKTSSNDLAKKWHVHPPNKKKNLQKIYHMFSLKMIRSKCKNSSESSDENHLFRKETFLFNKQIHLGLWLITDLSSLCLEILILSRSSIVLTLRGSSSACLKHNKNNQSRGQKQGYFTWMCSWFSEFDS